MLLSRHARQSIYLRVLAFAYGGSRVRDDVFQYGRRDSKTRQAAKKIFCRLHDSSASVDDLMVTETLMIIVLGVCVSALSMFAIILHEQIESYVVQQREIAQQRASIMVLQMRPHFIYNAMMSIYYLCAKDSKKAQQVTLDFTTYLRKNFNAIASENTIPFSDELTHTRAYLAVEQVQFEDSL